MGEIVFVRWYKDILQGEVVENERNDQLVGMVAVRIPVYGVRITALFHPQHVYQSEDEANGISPIISPNPPKVATEEREIPRTVQDGARSYFADVYVNTMIQRFKAAHWNKDRNHLCIDALDEFYCLWVRTHDHRDSRTVTFTEVTLPSHTAKPVTEATILKSGTPKARLKSHKNQKEAVQLSLFD